MTQKIMYVVLMLTAMAMIASLVVVAYYAVMTEIRTEHIIVKESCLVTEKTTFEKQICMSNKIVELEKRISELEGKAVYP